MEPRPPRIRAQDPGTTGNDLCRPTLCALGAEPHAHCACGLPMPLVAARCDLCRSEGFKPTRVRAADHNEEWDGRRHPSLRLHRPTNVPPARYDDLLRAILGPVRGRNAEVPTAPEEAA